MTTNLVRPNTHCCRPVDESWCVLLNGHEGACQPLRDDRRCAICGWPLWALGGSCARGNCSMRPFPRIFYDLKRAKREYGHAFDGVADSP